MRALCRPLVRHAVLGQSDSASVLGKVLGPPCNEVRAFCLAKEAATAGVSAFDRWRLEIKMTFLMSFSAECFWSDLVFHLKLKGS